MVQWLRLPAPMQGAQVQSLVRELGSRMSLGTVKKKIKIKIKIIDQVSFQRGNQGHTALVGGSNIGQE